MSAADCPLPLDCSETYGRLTIDGWSLHTGAWCATDLSSLLEAPPSRGENVLVETRPYRVPRPVVDDEWTVSLPMMFSGAVDREDTPYATGPVGLFANRRVFYERMVAPIRSGTASLPAQLVEPDGTIDGYVREGPVQPIDLEWSLLPGGYARAVLVVRVVGALVHVPPEE